ncbi:hypothetical protein C5F49_01975 [Nitrosopumilus oxyclinae]|uniref:DNA 3'-5' helicase n=1 Tax=Nitrosopumilus oxyclinae TaxID=1959104 RepID=A0A7D5M0U3_9ARCH|nr:ATP-dependent DNA helicase [Nitrosopumilus oxyclinae]QLH04214.1 hypothetical protein C5F49_01975 [Nitrosopumilus oxyclinae]
MRYLILNPSQKQAAEHLDGPLLVSAGPGSGKTRVIVERIRFLVENGHAKKSEILCLTFSEKAAQVMSDRLEEIFGDVSEMHISTFHSFCHDILGDNVLETGIGITDVIDRASLLVWGLKNIDDFKFEHIEIGNNAAEVIESLIDGISTFKDELVDAEELRAYLDKKLSQEDIHPEERDYLYKLDDMYKVYVKHVEFLRSAKLIDFDDMIVLTNEKLQEKPNMLKNYQNKFKYVLVDEFQDNNFAQFQLVRQLTPEGNLTVVGDSDQSIYKFQGAYDRIFQHFKEAYPKATEVILPENYRSPKNLVELAGKLLEPVIGREPKKLFSNKDDQSKTIVVRCNNEMGEVEYVVNQIKEILNASPEYSFKDFAVLSRKRADGKKFAQSLNAFNIPANYVGDTKIFTSSTGKNMLSYLKIMANPTTSGRHIYRVLRLHGISEQNISKIMYESSRKARKSDTDNDFVYDSLNDEIAGITQKSELRELSELFSRITKLETMQSVSESILQVMMKETDLYKNLTRDDTLESRNQQSVLKEIFKIAQQFENLNPDETINDFLGYLESLDKFDIETEEGLESDNTVQVSTIHQSKGKEFPFVFVVDVAQRKMPLKYNPKTFYVPDELSKGLMIHDTGKESYIKEERRLLYVAMTRASNQLFMIFPIKYTRNKRPNKPSQFLEELKYEENNLIELVEFNGKTQESMLQEQERLGILKNEYAGQAITHLNQMQFQSAINRIIDLAKIDYFEKNKTLDGFSFESILQSEDNIELENQLFENKIPLINKEKLQLSKSKFSVYQECPLEYKFSHILRVPTSKGTAQYMGNAFHKVVEILAGIEKQGRTPTYEEALNTLEKTWNSNSYLKKPKKKEAEDRQLVENMLQTYISWLESNPNTVVDVEKEFQLEFEGVKVTGNIDRIEKTPEGKYHIVDFKTGKSIPSGIMKNISEDLQMNLYSLGVEKLYNELPERTSLYYIRNQKVIPYDVEQSKVTQVKKQLEENTKSILNEEFDATPGQPCRNCNYNDICDFKATTS